jgi:hypothetical protein
MQNSGRRISGLSLTPPQETKLNNLCLIRSLTEQSRPCADEAISSSLYTEQLGYVVLQLFGMCC